MPASSRTSTASGNGRGRWPRSICDRCASSATRPNGPNVRTRHGGLAGAWNGTLESSRMRAEARRRGGAAFRESLQRRRVVEAAEGARREGHTKVTTVTKVTNVTRNRGGLLPRCAMPGRAGGLRSGSEAWGSGRWERASPRRTSRSPHPPSRAEHDRRNPILEANIGGRQPNRIFWETQAARSPFVLARVSSLAIRSSPIGHILDLRGNESCDLQ
jgi:hypothetical protein